MKIGSCSISQIWVLILESLTYAEIVCNVRRSEYRPNSEHSKSVLSLKSVHREYMTLCWTCLSSLLSGLRPVDSSVVFLPGKGIPRHLGTGEAGEIIQLFGQTVLA